MPEMSGDIPIYEDRPKYDKSLKVLLVSILALTLVPGLICIPVNIELALSLIGVTAFDGLLFAVIIPRSYQIFEGRIRIKLGGPLAINIPMEDIKEVKRAGGSEAFIYWGIRLATSTSTVIEIVRRKGMNVVISPRDDDMFLDQFEQARNSTVAMVSR
jgi:hypothetical protein